jgi:hypothetical protein
MNNNTSFTPSYVSGNHLVCLLPLNGKTISLTDSNGVSNRVQIFCYESKVVYPVKGIAFTAEAFIINCQNEYCYIGLDNYETFDFYYPQFAKMLEKLS